MSLKMKLTSAIIMFMLAIATLVIGVLAAQTQSINMEGTINFEISDRSLYVKNVRLEDSDGTTTEITSFMPGYINDGITLSLGTHTVSNTSFKIHFDLINTTQNTYNAVEEVTLSPELSSQGVTASASGQISPTQGTDSDDDGYAEIMPTSKPTGTITLTISSTSTQAINLGDITITIEQYIPRNLTEEGFTISGNSITRYTGTATDLVIPSSYKIDEDGKYIEDLDGTGTSITTIGTNAFQNNTTLTSITIPDTVISIGNGAFQDCRNLQTVNFGINSSLQTIGSSAFRVCNSLTTITIPANVTSIGINAFIGCTNLQYHYGIEGEAMYLGSVKNEYFALIDTKTDTLTEIKINQNCQIIADYAFYSCTNLQTVDFGANSQLRSIGSNSFNGCINLQTVDFGANSQLRSIGSNAFRSCSPLIAITIPKTVINIDDSAFYGCSALTFVVIESQEIYESALNPRACGFLLRYAQTVKVPTSIVNAYENSYLESETNFTPSTEMIGDVEYTVFTKVGA